MTQKHQFTVDVTGLKSIGSNLLESNRESRYHNSYAVAQLARMGALDLSADLPLAIRLDRYDEVFELYNKGETLVLVVDMTEGDPADTENMAALLERVVTRRILSAKPDALSAKIIASAKSYESAPEKLDEWPTRPEITQQLAERIKTLLAGNATLKSKLSPEELSEQAIAATTVAYRRRRHGRLGEESLWGMESHAVKVLQDAGIAQNDLGRVLSSILTRAAQDALHADEPAVFYRRNAYLLIRDFQRRARVLDTGVRMVDEYLLADENLPDVLWPRNPSWNQSIRPQKMALINRGSYDSALKWARRAAITSGRGLLPVFMLTGEPGMGKSVLLKQIAWTLHQQGFSIGEILDPAEVAQKADELATAAVAGDSPMILILDDPLGIGECAASMIKELATAQISGAPLVLLGATTPENNPARQIKRLSRTAFEEFEVHPISMADVMSLAGDATPEPDPETPDTSTIAVWTRAVKSAGLTDVAGRIWKDVTATHEKLSRMISVVTAFNMLGLATPRTLMERMFSEKELKGLANTATPSGHILFRSLPGMNGISGEQIDLGHPVFVRELWQTMASDSVLLKDLYDNLFDVLCSDSTEAEQQKWITRIVRAMNGCDWIPPDITDSVNTKIIQWLNKDVKAVSTAVVCDLFKLADTLKLTAILDATVETLARHVREAGTAGFIALPVLLRNNLGGLEDTEKLGALNAAKPSLDRIGFNFLLRYLGDHIPGDSGQQAVEDARTAAARDPDSGYAVAAYLRLVWLRGTPEQIDRAVEETQGWLEVNPQDRLVRRAFADYILKKSDDAMKVQFMEQLESWLESNLDEGPLRRSYLDLAHSLGDPAALDRGLSQIADWIERYGNNRSVRMQYFRLAERRNDKKGMKRACEVAAAWLDNHPEDLETLRSMIFLSNRTQDQQHINRALDIAADWLQSHTMDREFLKHYIHLAERSGQSRQREAAVTVLESLLEESPDDNETRETLLGLASQRVNKKVQTAVYDRQIQWLGAQETPDTMLEYLIGRLGVRAGVARRAIPLLERAAVREGSALQDHARLWLGSAYRISGDYQLARRQWENVLQDGKDEMKAKAQRNLESLQQFLDKKYPNGLPEDAPPPRPARPRPRAMQEQGDRPERPARPVRPDRIDRPDQPAQRDRAAAGDPRRKPRPGDQRPRRDKGKPRGKPQERRETPRSGATLGDLLRMKGLNLMEELEKSSEE